MRPLYYILDDAGEPQPCETLAIWGAWFDAATQTGCRIVAEDLDEGENGVSTVFIGLNHRYLGEGPPIVWESRIFGGPLDGVIQRYTSRAEAERGHRQMVRAVQAARRFGWVR